MPSALRCIPLAFALLSSACSEAPPPACEQLGQVYCEAAGVDCAAAKRLFTAADLSPTQCQQAIDDLRGVLPMLGPDTRGVGLSVFLREVMRGSPKLSKADIDELSRSVGLPPDEPAPHAQGPLPDPAAPGPLPDENRFVGYGEVAEPAPAPATQ